MGADIEIKDKLNQSKGLKIEPFRKHVRKTAPHKHKNYFEVIFLTRGTGTHTIDTKEYEIKSPIIFTVRKEQVHCWDITTEPEGYVLIVKNRFIDQCVDNDIKQLIYKLSKHNSIVSSEEVILNLFSMLEIEYRSSDLYRDEIIEGLLKSLLAKILQSASLVKDSISTTESILDRFIGSLSNDKRLINSVDFYAKRLNTTPQNLNVICRKSVNKSASELISEYIIDEAKRLLLYTDASVSEISDTLSFSDNSNFGKYFKRHVGVTPNQFRKSK